MAFRRFFPALLVLSSLAVRAELPEPVRGALAAAGLPEDSISVVLTRLSDDTPVLTHRPDESLQPASTMKLLTSMVALETLGPAYTAATRLRSSAPIEGPVLRGDLVLQGGGDVDFDWRALEAMLQSLRLRGVREIAGDLVLDLTRFQPPRTDIGLPPFDEETEFRYNVIPDALLLNTYLVHLDMASDARGVRLKATPELDRVRFVPEFTLVEGTCPDWEDGWKPPVVSTDRRGRITVRLRGTYPRNCVADTELNVLDRTVFVERAFRALWTRLGGVFRGRVREGTGPADTRILAKHSSRPLAELVREIGKRSDNPVTRVVYLNLGATSGGDSNANTAKAAESIVRAWMQKRGIADDGLVLDNGSGLSRTERIRPSQLAAVLRYAPSSRWAPEFLASLPIVALDGSMRRRLASSPAAAQARIKTGTLRNVSAIAGYVDDAQGRRHVLVAIINHDAADRRIARPILDVLLDWAARQGG